MVVLSDGQPCSKPSGSPDPVPRRATAEMLKVKDRENRALRLELFNTRADHWATLTRFAPAVQAGCMDTRDLYPVRSALPDMEASPHPVVPAGHRLLVQDLILAPLVHKLLRTVCSWMIMLNSQAMEVTSMRTTTDRSELGVASLVRTSCVIYRPA